MTRLLLVSIALFISFPAGDCFADEPDQTDATDSPKPGVLEELEKTDPESARQLKGLFEYFEKTDYLRARERRTYDRLVDEADLIVIGKFSKVQPTKLPKHDRKSFGWSEGMVGIESQFSILAVMKTTGLNEGRPKSISMIHFGYDKEVWNLTPQQFLDFSRPVFERKEQITVTLPQGDYRNRLGEFRRVDQDWKYLLFLKAREDGRYEPVSVQYFPNLSVKKVGD